ncbi:MAG TPA: hypothetical protein VJ717_00630 [Gemmatimonadaceae bacterium]|nr:hypothetical protein [Gemmatimonadaceae bacterium]
MRSALWYLLLVGMPVLALMGVLRLGQGLDAPRAVHGLYAVTYDSATSGPCIANLTSAQPNELTVAQSGTRLDVRVGDLLLVGAIAGDSVYAAAPGKAFRTASCETLDSVAVTAVVVRTGSERALVGQVMFRGCATCAPARFRALRVPERSSNRGLDA